MHADMCHGVSLCGIYLRDHAELIAPLSVFVHQDTRPE
jgi:hypothetical protein